MRNWQAEDGSVWGCGSNENGELGLGTEVVSVDAPTRLPFLANVEEVHAGLTFAVYRDDTGAVFGTGSNLFGQMCVSTEGEQYTSPTVSFDVPGRKFLVRGRDRFFSCLSHAHSRPSPFHSLFR